MHGSDDGAVSGDNHRDIGEPLPVGGGQGAVPQFAKPPATEHQAFAAAADRAFNVGISKDCIDQPWCNAAAPAAVPGMAGETEGGPKVGVRAPVRNPPLEAGLGLHHAITGAA